MSKLEHEAKRRLIGKGKFGCVFYPPLTSFGPRRVKQNPEAPIQYAGDHNYVMKVMQTRHAKQERDMGKIIHCYDPQGQFFVSLLPDVELVLKREQYQNMWNWDPQSSHLTPTTVAKSKQIANYYMHDGKKEDEKKTDESSFALASALCRLSLLRIDLIN